MSATEEGAALPAKPGLEEISIANPHAEHADLVEKDRKPTTQFIGLSKEELSVFAEDPFWIRTRRALFFAFWAVWIAMVVAAAVIIAVSPRCPPRPPQKWWDDGAVYRVFVKSYKDSNGDGVGDFKGLRSKFDYIKNLGVNSIALSPFFARAMDSKTEAVVSEGADVINFMAPNAELGTLAEVKALFKDARKKGLKVVVEIDPNQSSDQHRFFNDSVTKLKGREDFYVWHNSADSNKPPNSWQAVDGTSAWHWSAERGQWYYGRLGKNYPEFNYRSAAVREIMKTSMSYWLNEGIDGFLVRSTAFLVEDETVEDGFQNRPESVKFVAEIRKLIDDYTAESGRDAVLIVDAADTTGNQRVQDRFYHSGVNPGAHVVLNNDFIRRLECDGRLSGSCLQKLVQDVVNSTESSDMSKGNEAKWAWPNWLVSDPSVRRLGSRVERLDLRDAFNLLLLTLRGTPLIWYGDEIGMAEKKTPFSPMQWDDTSKAGFTNGDSPWTPLGADAKTLNVRFELAVGNDESILKTFVHVAKLRRIPAFMYGDQLILDSGNDNLFAFVRHAMGHPKHYVAVNFGNAVTTVPVGLSSDCPKMAKVVATTSNAHPDISVDKVIDVKKEDILLKPGQGVVLRLGDGL